MAENIRLSACLEKAIRRGDTCFTLVGQDQTSPEVVAYWILKNIETAPEEKLRDALEHALKMRITVNRKAAD